MLEGKTSRREEKREGRETKEVLNYKYRFRDGIWKGRRVGKEHPPNH